MDNKATTQSIARELSPKSPTAHWKPIRLINYHDERERIKSLKRGDFISKINDLTTSLEYGQSSNNSMSFSNSNASINQPLVSKKLSVMKESKRELSADNSKYLCDIATAAKQALSKNPSQKSRKPSHENHKEPEEKKSVKHEQSHKESLYSTLKKLKTTASNEPQKVKKIDIASIHSNTNIIRSTRVSPVGTPRMKSPMSPTTPFSIARNCSQKQLNLKFSQEWIGSRNGSPADIDRSKDKYKMHIEDPKLENLEALMSAQKTESTKHKRLTKDQENNLVNRLQKTPTSSLRFFKQ
ncbi:unnamed protein product [Blepharisma stoltei]|uniref:Uncharacterized protein n=1 Tax=Blepharisma stoltei TaxID=1481888 RepID=A0AAU9IQC7_9CILI|nr:unnamed protein product [Blepharisma stoltei]